MMLLVHKIPKNDKIELLLFYGSCLSHLRVAENSSIPAIREVMRMHQMKKMWFVFVSVNIGVVYMGVYKSIVKIQNFTLVRVYKSLSKGEKNI